MKQTILIFTLLLLQTSSPVITSPQANAELRGQVIITGTINLVNFSYAELAFSYAGDNTGTWFIIETNNQPIENGSIGVWDTTSISDGIYNLRLRVYLLDGSFQETAAANIQVKNDTLPATVTPTSTQTPPPNATNAPLPTPIPVTVTPIFPTPIPLPANPASINESQISSYLQRGAVVTLVLFLLIGLITRIRRS